MAQGFLPIQTINQQIFSYYCSQFFTLDGENESDHLDSSINLVIDVLIIIQLIEHLDCCLSLFRVLRYIGHAADQPAAVSGNQSKKHKCCCYKLL